MCAFCACLKALLRLTWPTYLGNKIIYNDLGIISPKQFFDIQNMFIGRLDAAECYKHNPSANPGYALPLQTV